jgi:ABC-type nitrate/sulfonate/bicarbonate transport system substrate-binding protein
MGTRYTALALVLTVATTGVGCQLTLPPDTGATRLRAAYTSAVDIGDLPSLLAHRALDGTGYRVEPTFFAQPELAVEALASGGVDVASGGNRAFWAAAAKGADLLMIMEHSENGYQLAAVTGISRCEDLHKRTLALSSQGSLPTALGDAYLQRCPAAKPRVLIMPHSGDRLSALLAGAVDAAVLQRADVTRLEQQAPGRFTTLEGFAAAFPDLDFEGVFVTRRFARTQRAAVVDYVKERVRANRRVLANPALLFEEARRWPTMGTLGRDVVEGEVRAPAWARDGGVTRASVAATLDFFIQVGSLPPSLTTDGVADLSFLEEALKTLEEEGEAH